MTDSSTAPVVRTTSHGPVRGTREDEAGAVFAGIPFAAPPIGTRRFLPPEPPPTWTEVRDATRFPAPPAQAAFSFPALAREAGGAGSDPFMNMLAVLGSPDEDCLYLNVWTPEVDGRRPVLVLIFGGGFETGSCSPPWTDGAALSRLTGAVVVTFNYRLGALGWIHPAGPDRERWAMSANLGLQDQAAALGWVRDNITGFGGDPGNVTIAGGSAGARSVGALLALPAAAGTFRKAILQSGSTGRIRLPEDAAVMTEDLMAALDVKNMDALAALPVERIIAAQKTVTETEVGRRNLRGWGPVLDGTMLPVNPRRAVETGAAAHIPLMLGTNRDKVAMWAAQGQVERPRDAEALLAEMTSAGVAHPADLLQAYRARLDHAPGGPDRDELTTLRMMFLSDTLYRLPAVQTARAQTAAGGSAHTYLFTGQPFGEQVGATHGAEAIYLSDRLASRDIDTPEHRALRDELAGAWAGFIADGDPGWPADDPSRPDNSRLISGTEFTIAEPPTDVTSAWGCTMT
ncbi:carboxylesterase/lipase family protein [Streptomyces mirabilis]|uniref:carboxylesterase/lipase family protein n=1 Tax=Streptomyces mirabilis TaxID=68239 RepID=UPI0036CF5A09